MSPKPFKLKHIYLTLTFVTYMVSVFKYNVIFLCEIKIKAEKNFICFRKIILGHLHFRKFYSILFYAEILSIHQSICFLLHNTFDPLYFIQHPITPWHMIFINEGFFLSTSSPTLLLSASDPYYWQSTSIIIHHNVPPAHSRNNR